jgi:alkaline phosphatase
MGHSVEREKDMCIRASVRIFSIVLLAVALMILLTASQALAARNVILMIGDGMGFQHVNAGSYYLNGTANSLSFSPYYKASVTTYCLDSTAHPVTDSAAAGSALATGHKVNYTTISQSPTGEEYPTILEIAKSMGKRTGLVTTDPITRATPAAFAAHDPSRYNLQPIGMDYLNSSQPNVLFGGGGYLASEGTFWSSAQTATAVSLGYTSVTTKSGMNALTSANEKALGIFTTTGPFPYEYNGYSSTTPHLNEMTAKALEILNGDPDGFFLMVEGALIDYGAHANNIQQTTREVTEFNNTAQTVLNWMAGRTDTLLIVTADHETGGLTATNRGAGLYPTATWTSTDHTGANVPFYIAGTQSGLADKYIVGGVTDNTKVFSIMNEAFNTPVVPEPTSLLGLLCGFGGTGLWMAFRKKRL